ncbi:MAG: tetratricopeptide repeat protein [Phycisphaerae bacterium]|nr:tetratricopeptide repeat protein [Tepidisphaeraceae bacterium]
MPNRLFVMACVFGLALSTAATDPKRNARGAGVYRAGDDWRLYIGGKDLPPDVEDAAFVPDILSPGETQLGGQLSPDDPRRNRPARAGDVDNTRRLRIQGQADLDRGIQLLESGQRGGGKADPWFFLNQAIESGGFKWDAAARLYRARAAFLRRDLRAALTDANVAILLDPRAPQAYRARADVLASLGHFDAALRDVAEAIRLRPDAAEFHFFRATALNKVGRTAEAVTVLDDLIRLERANPKYFEQRGLARFDRGDDAAAWRDFEAGYPSDPARLAEIRKVLNRLVPLRDAAVAADRVADPAAAYADANKRYFAGEYTAAFALYRRAVALDPRNADYATAAAAAASEVRDAHLQVYYATRALAIDPRNAVAYKLRGWGYRKLRSPAHAEREFSLAIELDPTYAAAYLSRAQLYHEVIQDNAAAKADYDEAVRIAPNDAKMWVDRGVLALEQGPAKVTSLGMSVGRAYGPAYADFDRAIRIKPTYTLAYLDRGIALAAMGEVARARADFDKAFELEPWDRAKHQKYVTDTLGAIQQATAMGEKLVEELRVGWRDSAPAPSRVGDDDAAANQARRDKWNRDTAMENASKAGDRAAQDRIGRGEGTWRDKDRYGY